MLATVEKYSQRLLDLAALIGVGDPWAGAKVALFKNNYTPLPSDPLANFEAADFSGYAVSAAIVWGTPFYLPDGTPCVTSDLKVFTVGASPTVFNTIYGYLVQNSGGTDWLFARKFDTPIVLSQEAQAIEVLASFPSYPAP